MSESDRTIVTYEDMCIVISKIEVRYIGGRFFSQWQASGYVDTSYSFSGFGRSPERAVKDALGKVFYRNQKEIHSMIRQK